MGEPTRSSHPEVNLWLMKIDENDRCVLLSSDHNEAWVRKDSCRQLPNGQWQMRESVARMACLDMGAT